jgi:uncharacterized protein with PIN domain
MGEFPMKLDEQQLTGLLLLLAQTEEVELTCDECFARTAEYAEHELTGKTPHEALEKVRQHLAICPDCREEYLGLLNAIRSLVS